jgi:hypothetical protein
MKTKLFIVWMFLLSGTKITAQTDTLLNVYLEKNQKHRTGVNLVFENNSNDTVLLFTRFRNFSPLHEISSSSGIFIEYFYDNKLFTFNWGDMYDQFIIFSKGRTLIYPKSKVRFFFNVGEYFKFPEKSSNKYEVSFFMNYLFGKYRSEDLPTEVTYFQTNRVTIVEPTEETEIK